MEQQKHSGDAHFALLIDADNVSSKYIRPIMDELSKYGTVTYKRIYGDWTSTLHAKWKDTLLENSLTPIQQFSYTQGKNATDSAMIIDAMDILYTNSVEGFCIVSSDSDFTRLASRIRESGLTVIGMGEKKTPTPFRKACDIFTTLELLVRADRERANGGHTTPKSEIEQAVVQIITDNQNNGKSTGLGEVGSRLLKQYPDFDVRSYGTNLLSKLLSEFESVDVIKDGSNVAVTLAEKQQANHDSDAAAPSEEAQPAPEDAAPNATKEREGAEGRSERPRRRRKSKVITTERTAAPAPSPDGDDAARETASPENEPAGAAPDAADEQPADAGTDDQPAEDAADQPAPTRRRRNRSAKNAEGARATSRAKRAAAAKKEPASPDDGATDADESVATPDAATEEPADDQAAAGKKKPRARRRASNATAADSAVEPTDTEPAKRTRGRRRKATSADTPADAAQQPAAAQPDQADDVAAYVRSALRSAGAEGADVSVLAKNVRAQFKGFKVRDLGFTQLRSYLASLDDIAFEKRDGATFARLAD